MPDTAVEPAPIGKAGLWWYGIARPPLLALVYTGFLSRSRDPRQ